MLQANSGHVRTAHRTAQAQCVALLRAHPDNEDAATMLAEIMFHQVGGGYASHGTLQAHLLVVLRVGT